MNTYIITVSEKEKFDSVKMKLIAQGFNIVESSARFGIFAVEDPGNLSSELVLFEIEAIPGVKSARKEKDYEAQ